MAIYRLNKTITTLVGLALVAIVSTSHAYTITYDTDDSNTSIVGLYGSWTRDLELQRWNAADFAPNSYLTGASIRIDLGVTSSFFAEATSIGGGAARLNYLVGSVTVDGTGALSNVGTQINTNLQTDWITMGAYDGITDFGGTSGFTMSGGAYSQSATLIQSLTEVFGQLTEVTGLGNFTLHSVNTAQVALSGTGGNLAMGSGYQGSVRASITYTYETTVPTPSTLFLLGLMPLLRPCLRTYRRSAKT